MLAIKILSGLAIVFGAMTIGSGSIILFTKSAIQKSVGHYVDFVVWFNLLSGIGYVISGYGLWKLRKWAVNASIAIAISISITTIAFIIHVIQGGQYEIRTFYAVIFRMLFWVGISIISCSVYNHRE